MCEEAEPRPTSTTFAAKSVTAVKAVEIFGKEILGLDFIGIPAIPSAFGTALEARDETDRIEVERFFSREKRTCGAALVVTRLKETTLASIALSVFVANLFGIPAGGFFVLYFLDLPGAPGKCHLCEFSGAAA